MPSILYLLVREDKTSFKIGITDNLESRHDRLRMVWGSFDLASSCIISGSHEEIAGLEKTLHYLLKKWRVDHEIKLDGHSEWFSMECFEKTLEIISLIAHIKEAPFDKRIEKIIDLSIKNTKPKKNKDNLQYVIDLTDLKKHWPSYEKATLDFRDDLDSNGWLWTVDLSQCQISPYELLAFQVGYRWIALASSYRFSLDTQHIIHISLSKFSLNDMGSFEGFKEAHEFLSDMIPRLAALKNASRNK